MYSSFNAIKTNMELFTGRTDEINRFRDFLSKIKSGGEEKRGCILSGEQGVGKTFTLKKFKELAQIERFNAIYQRLTPGSVENFFVDLKDQITELAPKKKSRFSLRGEEDLSMPPLPEGTSTAPEIVSNYVDHFFNGLDDAQERLAEQNNWVIFLIDDFNVFAKTGFENAYSIIFQIVKELNEKKYNIAIVFSISDEFMKYISSEDLETNFEMLHLEKISAKEAEIFLKRIETKFNIKIEPEVKEKLIRAGRGIPFFLTLATSYLYANTEDSDIDEETWNKCQKEILEEDIVKLFDLNDKELKILENIASRRENLATLLELEAITETEDLSEVLNSLQEKQLLVVENTFAYFSSNFLFQTLKRKSERLNIFGRANILLDLFKESIGAGKRPDTQLKKKLDELADIAFHDNLNAILTEIAEVYSFMGETLIEQEMFFDGFALLSSAIEIFEKIEYFERAALLCDEMAKVYSRAKKPYYSRQFLAVGAKLYDKVGSEWKKNALSRSAAMLYEEAGDVYAAESFDAFTRLFYRRAFSLYKAANESMRAKKVCQKAKDAISNTWYQKEFDRLSKQINVEAKRDINV